MRAFLDGWLNPGWCRWLRIRIDIDLAVATLRMCVIEAVQLMGWVHLDYSIGATCAR